MQRANAGTHMNHRKPIWSPHNHPGKNLVCALCHITIHGVDKPADLVA
jgi:hypothetical protein